MHDKPRIVICTGGDIGPEAMDAIQGADLLIGADRGALYLVENGFTPDLSLGDFDSVSTVELSRIRSASRAVVDCDPVMKDLTDTEMAFNYAVELRPKEIVMLGALGSRFDHSLANVHLLLRALQLGIACCAVNSRNRVWLTDRSLELTAGPYTQVSLLPLSMEVTGITLVGFQYPLHRATLTLGQSLGISNVLSEPTGTVHVESGYLLVIQSMD
jgi:thiamine pyrophosphokinase